METQSTNSSEEILLAFVNKLLSAYCGGSFFLLGESGQLLALGKAPKLEFNRNSNYIIARLQTGQNLKQGEKQLHQVQATDKEHEVMLRIEDMEYRDELVFNLDRVNGLTLHLRQEKNNP